MRKQLDDAQRKVDSCNQALQVGDSLVAAKQWTPEVITACTLPHLQHMHMLRITALPEVRIFTSLSCLSFQSHTAVSRRLAMLYLRKNMHARCCAAQGLHYDAAAVEELESVRQLEVAEVRSAKEAVEVLGAQLSALDFTYRCVCVCCIAALVLAGLLLGCQATACWATCNRVFALFARLATPLVQCDAGC